jgi:hypothetical protein
VKAKAMAQVFNPGEKVVLFYGFADRRSPGLYEIVRCLPASADNERQYQVRGSEGFDRVIGERQIRARLSEATVTSAVIRTTSGSPVRASAPGSHNRSVSLAGRAA